MSSLPGRLNAGGSCKSSTTAPRYLSGGGNTDPLPENVGKGLFDGSTVVIVVEGKGEER